LGCIHELAVTLRALIFLSALLAFSQAANAQKYCARFYDDTQTCGIPSLRDCEQTVSGVGGDCIIDDTGDVAPRPGPLQRWIEGQPDGKPSSPGLDDVPPPPMD
jgi:hypothetical protein